MPVTRRTTRASAAASGGGGGGKQSTISFKNKITKSNVPSVAGKIVSKPAVRTKEVVLPPSSEPEGTAEEEEVVEVKKETKTEKKSEAEIRAAKVTDAAINKYWKGIEDSRMAKEVHRKHTRDLTTGEKVLRYFDVSSQYGPCIGITRLKRWQRAERLGLHPPIEALAVLLKEEAKGNGEIEGAHMDELLSSTATGSN
ncbi:DNA polymerase delta subunit 4 [Podospora australis]|uniref:DNA polymerase delta subunit 4 n=1 Tax=Podospora australis TaxID=1536484 RepID=A0AAN7AKA5_9PEZI|nr:DNA polymerase delta subunit 4 [Podospora australis]